MIQPREKQVDDLRLHREIEHVKAQFSNKILKLKVNNLTESVRQILEIIAETEVYLHVVNHIIYLLLKRIKNLVN